MHRQQGRLQSRKQRRAHRSGLHGLRDRVDEDVCRRVDAFAPRLATPTVEDVGEGQVSGGRGYVSIDPAFADTMDRSRPYLVMLTPEGPSRGLYVTGRTPSGFSVRENPGGASTLGFTYRIVAKPFDTAARRLPADNDR
jgi:hypothetical protein